MCANMTDGSSGISDESTTAEENPDQHDSLKYHLLGPSLTKAGQDSVDQQKVRKRAYTWDTWGCI